MNTSERLAFKPNWEGLPPLSIDFDGCLHEYSKGYIRPDIYDPPMPGAHDALQRLMRTHSLHILTARGSTDVIKWCRKHFTGICFEQVSENAKTWERTDAVGVTNIKLPAISYIGKYVVRFTSWDDLVHKEPTSTELALRERLMGELPKLRPADWGYIGALIDGEGCFAASVNGKGRAYLRVIITNQHIEELEWIKSHLKGSIYTKKGDGVHFPVSWWTRDGIGLLRPLEHMLKLKVIRMKREQAMLACRYWRSLRYNGRKITDLQRVEQAQLLEGISTMNHNGMAFIHPVMIDDRALRFTNWQDVLRYFQ